MSFAIVGPVTWYSLPSKIRSKPISLSILLFRKCLKSVLFAHEALYLVDSAVYEVFKDVLYRFSLMLYYFKQ